MELLILVKVELIENDILLFLDKYNISGRLPIFIDSIKVTKAELEDMLKSATGEVKLNYEEILRNAELAIKN